MDAWPDEKIRNNACWYIQKHAGDPESWRYWRFTRVGECHLEILSRIQLEYGELVIVSSFITDSSWYALTTRRIIGAYDGRDVDARATSVVQDYFGNFKGHRGVQTETMRLKIAGQEDVELEFETDTPSMAPIYYMRFWKIKYPVLHKLKHNPYAASEL